MAQACPDRLLNAEAGRRNRWESANSEGIKYAAKKKLPEPLIRDLGG